MEKFYEKQEDVEVTQNQEENQEVQFEPVQEQPTAGQPLRNEPYGIGGWLIVVLIGLIITTVRLSYFSLTEILPLFSTIDSLGDPTLTVLLTIEFIANIFFSTAALILIILMFVKHRLFPKLMIGFYVINLVFIITDLLLASSSEIIQQNGVDPSSYKELIRTIVGAFVWIPYFLVSKRVKNTFI
jgi:hypothetical protein